MLKKNKKNKFLRFWLTLTFLSSSPPRLNAIFLFFILFYFVIAYKRLAYVYNIYKRAGVILWTVIAFWDLYLNSVMQIFIFESGNFCVFGKRLFLFKKKKQKK